MHKNAVPYAENQESKTKENQARFQFGLIRVIKTKMKSSTPFVGDVSGREMMLMLRLWGLIIVYQTKNIKRQPHILVRTNDDIHQKIFWRNGMILTEVQLRF